MFPRLQRLSLLALSFLHESPPLLLLSRQRPYISDQMPDVFIGFDFSESWHPAKSNSVFYDPEEFGIAVLLHAG